MTLELLYLPGCPNHGGTVNLLRSVLREEGVNTAVEEIPVNDYEEARALQFPESPTVRVNGEGIESVPSHRGSIGSAPFKLSTGFRHRSIWGILKIFAAMCIRRIGNASGMRLTTQDRSRGRTSRNFA
jgi:hypothetical protein